MRLTRISLFSISLILSGLVVTSCQLPTNWKPALGQPTVQRAQAATAGQELYPTAVEFNIPRQASSLNDTARLLAGMDGAGGIRNGAAWQQHKSQMDGLWAAFDTRHGQPVQSWASSNISDLRGASAVFYPFSGPDVLFAHHFFPSADTLVLCGLEPCEPLPDLKGLSDGEIAAGLSGLVTSLNTVMQYSFFITKDMRNDLVSTRFRGVLPVMLAFLARTGHSIESVDLVRLGSDGNPQLVTGSTAPGLMIRARSGFGATKRVFYFRQDLSDSGISTGSPILRFISSMGQPPAFVKSASYLMHEGGFSTIRNFLLKQCRGIVQDPSGVPYSHLLTAGHDIRLYGNYQGTIDMFSEHQQQDLIGAFAAGKHNPQPINFGVGYVFDPAKTCLMVARRR